MKHQFEVPYNFDEHLITFYKKWESRISFLYLPPFIEDLINTRASIQTTTKGHCYVPQSRKEYEYHIELIRRARLPFVILWQDMNNIISDSHLSYYSGLGASGFTIANDINAKKIKEFDSSLYVICSLVQRLRTNILERDFSNYDYIILYYCHNRALDAIKVLAHLKSKLILMPNTLCHIECPSVHHWFPSKNLPFNPILDCWTNKNTLDKCGFIFPEHLKIFNPHVGGYKLQGREYPTDAIKFLCHFYFEEEEFQGFITPFLREDMALELYRKAHNIPPHVYYNAYTPKLIDKL